MNTQPLRQAVDKLQKETQKLDLELAKAQEQVVFSEVNYAELRLELQTVAAQLKACKARKGELECTISKVNAMCLFECAKLQRTASKCVKS